MDRPKYRRVMLKISGEALAGSKGKGLDFDILDKVALAVKDCVDIGVQIGIVVGAGNFWRGVKDGGGKIERTRSDHMGMLATTINALALADVLESHGVEVRVQTAIDMTKVAEPYIRLKAIRHLEKNIVVIFACGTGNPYFSTDTAAALRAAEINADIVLMAKNIDGVYTSDPKKDPGARKLEAIYYKRILSDGLTVIDSTAASLGMENNIPMLLFGIDDPGNIVRAIKGEKIGTVITASDSKPQ